MADTPQAAQERAAQVAATYTPSEKDQALIGLVNQDFEAGKRNRQTYEGQWYTTSAFLHG